MPTVVTLGEHHQGPHVDALMALAERCGAHVVRVSTQKPRPPFQRASYAGKDGTELGPQQFRYQVEDRT